MKEVFEVGDELFSAMVAVDVLVASVWMAVLLFMAGESQRIDRRRGADTSALDDLKRRATEFQERHARIASMPELMAIVAVGFGVTGASHVLADSAGAVDRAIGARARSSEPNEPVLLARRHCDHWGADALLHKSAGT